MVAGRRPVGRDRLPLCPVDERHLRLGHLLTLEDALPRVVLRLVHADVVQLQAQLQLAWGRRVRAIGAAEHIRLVYTRATGIC